MMTILHAAASLLTGFLLLTFIGNAVCRRILIHTGLQKAREDLLKARAPDQGEAGAAVTPGAGAWIGGL